MSDESHFSRLLGYAANREAGILVWVARGFTDYYCSILRWLNASDTIDVYAVEVRAYRVGNSLAADFRTVVEPPQAQAGTSAPPRETASTHYAEFYRPLVTQLRRSEMQAVGKGGWRGRWRSFQTRYPHTVYATGLDEGKTQVFLKAYGPDRERIHHNLDQHRDEIQSKLNNSAILEREEGSSWVMLETEAAFNGPEDDWEETRQWMADNLLRLQAAVQPYLEQVMVSLGAEKDNGEGDA